MDLKPKGTEIFRNYVSGICLLKYGIGDNRSIVPLSILSIRIMAHDFVSFSMAAVKLVVTFA